MIHLCRSGVPLGKKPCSPLCSKVSLDIQMMLSRFKSTIQHADRIQTPPSGKQFIDGSVSSVVSCFWSLASQANCLRWFDVAAAATAQKKGAIPNRLIASVFFGQNSISQRREKSESGSSNKAIKPSKIVDGGAEEREGVREGSAGQASVHFKTKPQAES